jgi:NhaP-type Na+/H+ or K+/H+ antiporter
LLGVLLSPQVFDFISPELVASGEFFSNLVLGMIAFTLGQRVSIKKFWRTNKAVISISLAAALFTCFFVGLAFWSWFQYPFYIAFLLGAIACATDPASTIIVAQEYKARGLFSDTLFGIVAIDDAWALMIFALTLSVAKLFTIANYSILQIFNAVVISVAEIIGSLILGIVIVVIFNKFCYLINTSRERLIYTLGFLFLAIGVAILSDFSVLLTAMFMGSFLADTNKRSKDFFDTLAVIETPLYIIFFVLAGASLNLNSLLIAGFIAIAFVVVRSIGKIGGSFIGALFVPTSPSVKKYMGLALLPQAGVALACALVAKHTLANQWGDLILNITVATTVIFELIGPVFTKIALTKAGEINV